MVKLEKKNWKNKRNKKKGDKKKGYNSIKGVNKNKTQASK